MTCSSQHATEDCYVVEVFPSNATEAELEELALVFAKAFEDEAMTEHLQSTYSDWMLFTRAYAKKAAMDGCL